MFIAALANIMANALISAVLAPCCAVCSAILATPLEGCVCGHCWGSVRPIRFPICDVCGDPLSLPVDAFPPANRTAVCNSCIAHPRVIRRARAVGEYDGTLRDIIHALKYQHRHSLAERLATLMWASGRRLLHEADCVVPVPLHPRRERARGFNQARELARRLDLPVLEPLVRAKYTVPQVELEAGQRHANVRDAFRMRRGAFRAAPSMKSLRVVLVDDVSTTGATLEACAAVLMEAGAAEVNALTAARVVTRRH